MSAKVPHHPEKVRLTVECSLNEKTYIKMLAAKKHMTISELLLYSFRKAIPMSRKRKRNPNDETVKALKESRTGDLKSYETLEDFWKDMGIDPDA